MDNRSFPVSPTAYAALVAPLKAGDVELHHDLDAGAAYFMSQGAVTILALTYDGATLNYLVTAPLPGLTAEQILDHVADLLNG